MNDEHKRTIDAIIAIFMYGIFLPFVLLTLLVKIANSCMEYLFDKLFTLYNKVCKLVRGPIPNSVVNVKGKEYRIWHRVNDKLLTIKEAKALGKEYEDKGYKVDLHLSEF